MLSTLEEVLEKVQEKSLPSVQFEIEKVLQSRKEEMSPQKRTQVSEYTFNVVGELSQRHLPASCFHAFGKPPSGLYDAVSLVRFIARNDNE